MATFQLFFQTREQVEVRRGRSTEKGGWSRHWSPVRPVSSGFQVYGELGYCRARTWPPWWTSAALFLQNVLHLQQQRCVIFGVDSLALWKIINEEDAVLNPKIRGENFSSEFMNSEILDVVRRYTFALLIFALYPGHGDITRFLSWSPIATWNHLNGTEKNYKLIRWQAPLRFLIRVHEFRDPLRREFPQGQIFMNDGPNPLRWEGHPLNYWFRRNPAVVQN